MMKMYFLSLVVVVSQVTSFAQDKPDESYKHVWGASHHITVMGDDKETRLEGLNVSQRPEHLLGGFTLVRERQDSKLQLEVKGHLNKSGEFTPNVSLEVSDRRSGDWKTVESTLSHVIDVTLAAGPHIDRLPICIQLDALQPYIGKFEFWRITLQTGESCVFPMVWLTEKGE
jgi:hypothetical protein